MSSAWAAPGPQYGGHHLEFLGLNPQTFPGALVPLREAGGGHSGWCLGRRCLSLVFLSLVGLEQRPGQVTWPNVEKGTVYKGRPCGQRREGSRGEVPELGCGWPQV